MRVLIEVREEDVEALRTLAVRNHRSVREQAGYLLALKIHEEIALEHAPTEQVA